MEAHTPRNQPPTPDAGDTSNATPAPTPSPVYALIRNALLQRQQVVATYDGHRRGLCPHVLGTSNGRPQALFYQFGGTSRSEDILEPGTTDNWRCIPLAGLSDVALRDGPWHTAANYTPTQTCVDEIDVQVPDPDPPTAGEPTQDSPQTHTPFR